MVLSLLSIEGNEAIIYQMEKKTVIIYLTIMLIHDLTTIPIILWLTLDLTIVNMVLQAETQISVSTKYKAQMQQPATIN